MSHPTGPSPDSTAARPVVLGVVGDSAAGKTTLTRGLVRALGEEAVCHIPTDDYHRYDRKQRAELQITPLDPACNHIDIMAQHLALIRAGKPILKPKYRHGDGTFGPPEYVPPRRFAVVEGLLGYHTAEMRAAYDVRSYLAPPEHLRRQWKIARDTTRRGYSEQEVLADLERREPDSQAFIRPQEACADIVVSFLPGNGDGNFEHLAADLKLRRGLVHPDLSGIVSTEDGITLEDGAHGQLLHIPGDLERDHAAEIEHAMWARMRFAAHLDTEKLGEYKLGDETHRSESLALVQLLLLYHLAMAKATVALGGDDARADRPRSLAQ